MNIDRAFEKLREAERQYDIVVEAADRIIGTNPCRFKDHGTHVSCAKSNPCECCEGCFSQITGCTANNVWCKLYFCEKAHLSVGQRMMIAILEQQLDAVKIPCSFYFSKTAILGLLFDRLMRQENEIFSGGMND